MLVFEIKKNQLQMKYYSELVAALKLLYTGLLICDPSFINGSSDVWIILTCNIINCSYST